MIKDLANTYHKLNKKDKHTYLTIEFGKEVSKNIFITCPIMPSIIEKKFGKPTSEKEYYQYSYQNNIYRVNRNFKTEQFEENLIKNQNVKSSLKDITLNCSVIEKKPILIFSQQLAYHQIIFIVRKEWNINNAIKIKTYLTKDSHRVEIEVNLPASKQDIEKTENIIKELLTEFKHKSDKSDKSHSLDSILES